MHDSARQGCPDPEKWRLCACLTTLDDNVTADRRSKKNGKRRTSRR